MSELYDILVETPPTKVILLALDQGLWDCERSLAELAALCEANHMEAVAEVTQKRQTPETGIVLGSGKLEEAAAAAAELGAVCAVFDGELTGSQIRNISTALGGLEVIDRHHAHPRDLPQPRCDQRGQASDRAGLRATACPAYRAWARA